ncbi:hypothetical protein Vadar_009775 [Vaccinium darrowii]|uniref:Uncharacterized protein n=1 Tax=Vaccinium darrowii TaxID=229202 RepID=A0ACB7XPG6_9ERIC|nr:hypothetical protein Vadar_009775 [Vaccinium darrowii]
MNSSREFVVVGSIFSNGSCEMKIYFTGMGFQRLMVLVVWVSEWSSVGGISLMLSIIFIGFTRSLIARGLRLVLLVLSRADLDYHASKAALFDGFDNIEEGGIRASSSYSQNIDDHTNDKAINSLEDRVSFLKKYQLRWRIQKGLEIKQRVVHRKRKYLDSAPTALSLEQFKKDERNRRRREACARKKQFLIPREHSMVKQTSEEKETGLEIEQRVVHRKRKSLDSVPTLLSLEQSKKDERNKRRREAYARKKQLPIPGVVYIAPSVVEPVLVDLHDKGKEIVSRFSIFEIVSVRGCFGLCYLDFIFNLVRAFS